VTEEVTWREDDGQKLLRPRGGNNDGAVVGGSTGVESLQLIHSKSLVLRHREVYPYDADAAGYSGNCQT